MNKWFEWMIQWLTHKYFTCFITGWVSDLEQISWINDSMTNTFFNGHLSSPIDETIQSTQSYLASYFQK